MKLAHGVDKHTHHEDSNHSVHISEELSYSFRLACEMGYAILDVIKNQS